MQRQGNIVPILAITLAVLAFGAVAYFAVTTNNNSGTQNTNVVTVNDNQNVSVNANGNTNAANGNVNAAANVNVAVNTNTTVDATKDWKTYTNSNLGYSIKYPKDWQISTTDKRDTFFGEGAGTPFTAPSLTVATAVAPDPKSSCLLDETKVVVLGTERLRQLQGCGYAGSIIATYIENGATFILISWSEDVNAAYSTYELMLSTFTITNPTAEKNSGPISNTVDLSDKFSWDGYAGVAASVMGSTALIGSHGGTLYEYDGKIVTDISEKIKIPGAQVQVVSLADNGQHWMILTKEDVKTNHVYTYDGQQWTDLTVQYHAAQGDSSFPFGMRITWVHDRWFFFELAGKLLTFDGKTFSDITPKFPTILNQVFINAGWDGSAFQIIASPNPQPNTFSTIVYKYQNETVTKVGSVDTTRRQLVAGWNGKYWLLADEQPGSYFGRFDGHTLMATAAPADPGFIPIWLDPYWIVSGYYFDGEKLISPAWMNIERAYSIDTGKNFGLITNYSGRVIRFDLK